MERQDIPTLTELINKATERAVWADGDMEPTDNVLRSLAYSQIAIARSLSHQTDIMVAMLRTLSGIEAKVTQYADAYSSSEDRSAIAESVALWTPSES